MVISPRCREEAGTVGRLDFSDGQSLRAWACWKWVWFWKRKLVIKWCFLWGTTEYTRRAKTLQVIYYFIWLNPNSNLSSQEREKEGGSGQLGPQSLHLYHENNNNTVSTVKTIRTPWRSSKMAKQKRSLVTLMGAAGNRERDGWMASPIWRTWVWTNFTFWWWTRKPSMQQSMGLQKLDTTEWLKWTELRDS